MQPGASLFRMSSFHQRTKWRMRKWPGYSKLGWWCSCIWLLSLRSVPWNPCHPAQDTTCCRHLSPPKPVLWFLLSVSLLFFGELPLDCSSLWIIAYFCWFLNIPQIESHNVILMCLDFLAHHSLFKSHLLQACLGMCLSQSRLEEKLLKGTEKLPCVLEAITPVSVP